MTGSEEPPLSGSDSGIAHQLSSLRGQAIAGIRRIFYSFKGELNTSVGAIELICSDGSALLLDSGSDGEALRIDFQPWSDPFPESDMTTENRAFVELSGKWTAIDVTPEPEYGSIVGVLVDHVNVIRADAGKIIGVVIGTSEGRLRAQVEGDDLYVHID